MMNSREDNGSWKLGVLFSETGVTSVIEKSQRNGALLAIGEINSKGGVGGRPLEPVIYDPRSIPEEYGRLAEKLISEDGVRLLIGCYMSSARKEVLPVIERRNALFFYPTLYEGFEYSPNVIYGGACPNQNSVPLASYLLENYGTRFYFVGSDYIYPRESNRVMRNILRQGGGEVIGEHYLPVTVGKEGFADILLDIERTKPDVIFSTVVGEGTINFYQAYYEAGHDARKVPIASLTTNEAEISAIGAKAAVGHITAAPYFRTINTAKSRRFLQSYANMFGSDELVTSCCESAYFQVHMLAEALEREKSLDIECLREQLLGSTWDAPQGKIKIDPDNNHTYLHARIAKVDSKGDFIVEREVRRSIKPDPYLVTPDLNDRRFRLQQAS
ncbi:transporter substrate-binding domain-containing protein [Roseinatronobacter monicus]|uniref:Amino acid/amide ABC transporter substrate-binding protein (HAAT family) n=1 Tax=Roseinatronobacter monicus TaxID=393481 RepID=A0A543K4T4_9RHOB|nr:transporter substrate-binding domain-containing protein [Roseinatronobacter monicus]TQM90090.1 amino acid/amide ABC transporter substrate-binding protein (HAAT family) [Roseinatronobacter monicus]